MDALKIIELRDFLQALPEEQFDIMVWSEGNNYKVGRQHICGTVACIGGWGAMIFAPPGTCTLDYDHYNLASTLGISPDVAYRLTHPENVAWELVTRDVAVAALNQLLETGDVNYADLIHHKD